MTPIVKINTITEHIMLPKTKEQRFIPKRRFEGDRLCRKDGDNPVKPPSPEGSAWRTRQAPPRHSSVASTPPAALP